MNDDYKQQEQVGRSKEEIIFRREYGCWPEEYVKRALLNRSDSK